MIYSPTELDITMFMNSNIWAASPSITKCMEPYVVNPTGNEGPHYFSPKVFFERIQLAAQVICGIKNPKKVLSVAVPQNSQRAVSRFAIETESVSAIGKFTPGSLTNKSQKSFIETRLLIVSDPTADSQALSEAKMENVPVIGLCDSDADIKYIDVVIPCNNKNDKAIATVYFLLARTVLQMKRKLNRQDNWLDKFGFFMHISVKESNAGNKEKGKREFKFDKKIKYEKGNRMNKEGRQEREGGKMKEGREKLGVEGRN